MRAQILEPRIAVLAAVGPVTGGAVGLLAGSFTGTLVREQLHVLCQIVPAGSEGAGTWVCPDGISYLGAAVALGGMLALVSVAGALIASLVSGHRVARWLLTILSALGIAGALAFTWFASSELVRGTPPGVHGTDYWIAAVLPAAAFAGAGVASSVVAASVSDRGALALAWAGAGFLLIATVLQPGLGVATLPSAGLMVACAVRTPTTPERRSGDRAEARSPLSRQC